MEIANLVHETPMIEVQPMIQRSEVRNVKEDWTGKTSTAERRKLQNRLNKRGSRKRRGLAPLSSSESLQNVSNGTEESGELEPHMSRLEGLFPRVSPTSPVVCMMPSKRNSVITAPNFTSFMRTPLPSDQKLLTLLHFNLVRALTGNIFLLGLDPDNMNDDIPSPFNVPALFEKLDMKALPPALHPTPLQIVTPHHPEIDVFPFPRYRDNFLLAVEEIDDIEFCSDILYGVDSDPSDEPSNRLKVGSKGGTGPLAGRTGLIVWNDPWRQESWEIEEGFARKWKRLLVGCDDLITSTNYWRAKRGERNIVLD